MGKIIFLIFLILTIPFLLLLFTHLVHKMRRKYRLESMADARRHQRQLAKDFDEMTRQLSAGTSINFEEYKISMPKKKERLRLKDSPRRADDQS